MPYSAVAVKRDDSRETKTLGGRQNQQRKTIFTFYEKARETQGFPGIQNWIFLLFPMLFASFPRKSNSKLDFPTFPDAFCKFPKKTNLKLDFKTFPIEKSHKTVICVCHEGSAALAKPLNKKTGIRNEAPFSREPLMK